MLGVVAVDERRGLSAHFKAREFACRCCGMVLVHPELVRKLEALRYLLGGTPVFISSGYRCAGHNKAVGGVEQSYHVFGMAADIQVAGTAPGRLAAMAEKAGFDGIGVYREQGFVHVDVRGYPARWSG
jgi:uncharacterized protein YcbK (DUF882 family)